MDRTRRAGMGGCDWTGASDSYSTTDPAVRLLFEVQIGFELRTLLSFSLEISALCAKTRRNAPSPPFADPARFRTLEALTYWDAHPLLP